MLKSQDVVILLKLITSYSHDLKQSTIASHLYMSVSTVNKSLHNLVKSKLVIQTDDSKFICIKHNCIEFLISSVRYIFAGKSDPSTPTYYIKPLFPSIPKSMISYPDVTFINLISNIDKLRDCNTSSDDKEIIASQLKELLNDAFAIRDSRMIEA